MEFVWDKAKKILCAVLAVAATVTFAGCMNKLKDEQIEEKDESKLSSKVVEKVVSAIDEEFSEDESQPDEQTLFSVLKSSFVQSFLGSTAAEWHDVKAYENADGEAMSAVEILDELLSDDELFSVVTEDCTVEQSREAENKYVAEIYIKTVDFKKVFDERINIENGYLIIEDSTDENGNVKDNNCLLGGFGWTDVVVGKSFAEAVNNVGQGGTFIDSNDKDRVMFTFLINYVYSKNVNGKPDEELMKKYPITVEVERVKAENKDEKDSWKVITTDEEMVQQLKDMFLYPEA